MSSIIESPLREGEVTVDAPEPSDAVLTFIGRIHTPYHALEECPRQGMEDGPVCEIEVSELWGAALKGVEALERLQVFYWFDHSRRDVVLQSPRKSPEPRGTFSLRSPLRPNPIGCTVVKLERVEGNRLFVRSLDCLDGTPLIDLKPAQTR